MAIHEDSRVVALVETIDDFLIKMLAEAGAKNLVVLALPEAERLLKERGISHRRAREYLPENMNVYEEVVDWLFDLTQKTISKNTSLERFLAYEGFSLWWSSWPYLYDLMLKTITWTKLICNAIRIHRPTTLIVGNKSVLLGSVASSISKAMGVRSVLHANGQSDNGIEESELWHPYTRLVFLSLELAQRYILAQSLKLHYRVTGRAKHLTQSPVVLTSATVYLSKLDSKDIESDTMMGRIAGELLNRGSDIKIVVRRHHPLAKLQTVFKHRAPFCAYEYYFSIHVLIRVIRAAAKLERLRRELTNDMAFRNTLEYDNVPLWPILKDAFRVMFSDIFLGMIQHYETWRHILETERPKALVVESEYSSVGLGAIAACKSRSIPSIAVQHGAGMHPGYIRIPKMKQASAKVFSLRPLADRTVVFGEHTRQILTERGGYPQDSVVATGLPRFDVLAEKTRNLKEEDVRRKFGLRPESRVILCIMHAFQAKYGYPDYDKEYLSMMLEATRNLPQVHLVVKLHPIEDGEMERQLVERSGVGDVVITSEGLAEILSICEVVTMISSTVGIEAAILDKPIVVVNVTGQPDTVSFVEEGIAIGVNRESDLKETILKILNDRELRGRLEKNRAAFIRRHVYAVDGRAASRIADEADDLVKKKGIGCALSYR